MKIILHDINPDDGLPILALRAAKRAMSNPVGSTVEVIFEDNSTYIARRNKASVSVTPGARQ